MLVSRVLILVAAVFGISNAKSFQRNKTGHSDDSALQIVGGNSVLEGEFPFMVSLQRKDGKNFQHYCGGSLIAPQYVLTAGHCANSENVPGRVIVGIDNLQDTSRAFVASVESIIPHPKYSPYSYDYDLTVIKLRDPIDGLATIGLAKNNKTCKPGATETVIGFGYLESGSGKVSNQLMETRVPVTTNSYCNNAYHNIKSFNICAGFKDGGKDACSGDSGGPLFSTRNGTYLQVGIVSRGTGCAEAGYPGVYTRVSSFHSWIDSVTRE